jgi:hypothetical protein
VEEPVHHYEQDADGDQAGGGLHVEPRAAKLA